MTQKVLIYGATGRTGRLITAEAKAIGLDVILGGRSPRNLEALSNVLGLPWRSAPVESERALREALDGIAVVVNAAGPFMATAEAIVEACLDTGTDYLDVTGEIAVVRALEELDGEAQDRGITVVPAVGFSALAGDFLAAHVSEWVDDAQRLRIAISQVPRLSGGSVKTVMASARNYVLVVRDGQLARIPIGRMEREFAFNLEGDTAIGTAANLVETLAAYRSTGVRNIESYVAAGLGARMMQQIGGWLAPLTSFPPVNTLLEASAELLAGSGVGANDAEVTVLVEAEDPWRRVAAAFLEIDDPYRFTARAAAAAAQILLQGNAAPGLRSPAEALASSRLMARAFGCGPRYLPGFKTVPRRPPWAPAAKEKA